MRFIIRTFILNAQKYFFRLIKLKPMIIKVPVSNDYQNRFGKACWTGIVGEGSYRSF